MPETIETAPDEAPRDLTAILLPGDPDLAEVRRVLRDAVAGDVLVRVAPLPAVRLTQVEVLSSADGLPCESPELLTFLSKAFSRATFVHVNHRQKQALVHPFADGSALEGFLGAPGDEFDARLRESLGAQLPDIGAADDQSRLGIGVAASHTVAWVRGQELALPAGMPTDLNSFAFHDEGHDGDAGPRLAFFAFDHAAAVAAAEAPVDVLRARLAALTSGVGPLFARRDAIVAALAETPIAARDVDTHELLALAGATAFSVGDALAFWDERVLPICMRAGDAPVVDADDVAELEAAGGVFSALAEVLPIAPPPGGAGPLLHSLGAREIEPLAPPSDGADYHGSVFVLTRAAVDERLLPAVHSFEEDRLPRLLERFLRAWHQATAPADADEAAWQAWARAKEQAAAKDTHRFLRAWAELRVVLEVARANRLDVGLLFYEGA